MMRELGPLAPLAGSWEGEAGIDIAPAEHGSAETRYREHCSFEPLGPVTNGPQVLYGLRYHMTAWPLGEDEPFHEELGYWLWDGARGEVMRCFIVPRGVNVLAGGKAKSGDRQLKLHADLGSGDFGICANPFLNEAFRCQRYTLSLAIESDDCFSYEEDTELVIPGRDSIFHHADSNRLTRIR